MRWLERRLVLWRIRSLSFRLGEVRLPSLHEVRLFSQREWMPSDPNPFPRFHLFRVTR